MRIIWSAKSTRLEGLRGRNREVKKFALERQSRQQFRFRVLVSELRERRGGRETVIEPESELVVERRGNMPPQVEERMPERSRSERSIADGLVT